MGFSYSICLGTFVTYRCMRTPTEIGLGVGFQQ